MNAKFHLGFIFPFIILLSLQTASCKKKAEVPINDVSETEIPAIPVVPELKLNNYKLWKIDNGKFYYDNKWVFLKIAKPIRDFSNSAAVQKLISELDMLKAKKYNVIEINCYWHHFDKDGDGVPDVSLMPLFVLVESIYSKGMIPCLSVETYSVGGGQMPEKFWQRFPDAEAIDAKGNKMTDTEYGFGSRVVSIFHEGYRDAARNFIKNMAKAVDHKKILYFETTVEPQYMGIAHLCYSTHARENYAKWLLDNKVTDPSAQMPAGFPVPQSFVKNTYWNSFRAEFLADWVNGDAAAYREVAGSKAYVAVDYLDATEESMLNRNGNSAVFLDKLTGANIIQVNWSWYFPTNKPNQKAYDRVRSAMEKNQRDWAITEHMTFNGADFTRYEDNELKNILQNTLNQGTRFGWEFVNVNNSTGDSFSLYNNDWSPKSVISMVDDHWDDWLAALKRAEN